MYKNTENKNRRGCKGSHIDKMAIGKVSEVLRNCDLDEIIIGYANRLLLEGKKPQQWSDINIIPL